MQRRYIALSLPGPWANEGTSIQIRCRIEFPSAYPVKGKPRVALEDVPQLPNEARTALSSEIKMLTEAYLSHQRPSLEAILRYLLGEQTLEESLKWAKRHDMNEGQAFSVDDGLSSSSEEDEEDITRYGAPDALQMSDSIIGMDSTLYNVPLPRNCGAVWTRDGRLVCFHPPKPEKEASLLNSSLRLDPRRNQNTQDLFEGFGRLHKAYRSKTATGTLTSADSDDDFELSSSDSSSPSDVLGPLKHHVLPAMPWNGLFAGSNPENVLADSQISVGEFGQPSTSAESNVNALVSIHDFGDLLPVKKELAQHYKAQNGLEAVIENCIIAKESGFEELADTWQLCALLLQQRTKEQSWPVLGTSEQPLISDRGYLSVLSKDTRVDFSYNEGMKPEETSSWNCSQLAVANLNRRWFIECLCVFRLLKLYHS